MRKKIWVKPHSKKGKMVKGYYRTIDVSSKTPQPMRSSGKMVSSKPGSPKFFKNFFDSDKRFITIDKMGTIEGNSHLDSEVYYKDSVGVYRGADTEDGDVIKYVWKSKKRSK